MMLKLKLHLIFMVTAHVFFIPLHEVPQCTLIYIIGEDKNLLNL